MSLNLQQTQGVKPLLVTVAQGRAAINVGHSKFYDLINAGRIKVVKVGSRTLVNYASLEALASGEAA